MNNILHDERDLHKKKHGKFDCFATNFVKDLVAAKKHPLYTAGRFFLWDGTKYIPCDELDMLVRRYFRQHQLSQSNNVIGNVSPIVKTIAFKDSATVGPMPFWAGGDCPFSDVEEVVAFRNGLLDLTTDKLVPHTPKWCSTVCLPFEFNERAMAPRWLQFLDEVFEGDPKRANLLSEFVGYCMTWDISQQKALLMYGPPRSGKGSVLGVIERLVGDHFTGYSLDRLVSAFGLADLRDKLVAGVGELELAGNKDKNRIVERFKSITGGDKVSVEEKYSHGTSERIYARFVIATNTMPNLKDASGALLSRLLILPFQKSFLGKEDTKLMDKLVAELPGIANWALAGLKRLRQRGCFTATELGTAACREFGMSSAPVRQFILDRLLVAPTLNPGWLPAENIAETTPFIPTNDLYVEYKSWCDEAGVEPGDERFFGKDLTGLLPKLERKRRHLPGGQAQKWGYPGLGFRQML